MPPPRPAPTLVPFAGGLRALVCHRAAFVMCGRLAHLAFIFCRSHGVLGFGGTLRTVRGRLESVLDRFGFFEIEFRFLSGLGCKLFAFSKKELKSGFF